MSGWTTSVCVELLEPKHDSSLALVAYRPRRKAANTPKTVFDLVVSNLVNFNDKPNRKCYELNSIVCYTINYGVCN